MSDSSRRAPVVVSDNEVKASLIKHLPERTNAGSLGPATTFYPQIQQNTEVYPSSHHQQNSQRDQEMAALSKDEPEAAAKGQ